MTHPQLLPLRAIRQTPTIFTQYKPSGKPLPRKSNNGAKYDSLIAILNQGNTGWCTVFALMRVINTLLVMQGKQPAVFAPGPEYYEELNLIGHPGTDFGGYTWSIVEIAEKYGMMLQSLTPNPDDWKDVPLGKWMAQYQFDPSSFREITYPSNDFAQFHSQMQDALALGYVAITGIKAWEQIYSAEKGVLALPSGDSIGGHEIVIEDYDRDLEFAWAPGIKGYYRFVNSWGTQWGDGGYGYIPFDYFPEGLIGPVVVGIPPEAKPQPKPEKTDPLTLIATPADARVGDTLTALARTNAPDKTAVIFTFVETDRGMAKRSAIVQKGIATATYVPDASGEIIVSASIDGHVATDTVTVGAAMPEYQVVIRAGFNEQQAKDAAAAVTKQFKWVPKVEEVPKS